MQFFRILSGVILGLSPVVLGLFFGFLIYNYYPNNLGITVICASGLLGIFMGYKIFQLVRKVGFISFITALSSTQHIKSDNG